jgi:hypothetical protein
MRFAQRLTALCAGLAVGLGMAVAPPAPAATKAPGKTLTVTISGVPRATVKVTGPKRFTRTLQVDQKTRLRSLTPGRYTLRALPVGEFTAADPVQKVRVRKARGARVRFIYEAPDTTAPPQVTDLRVVAVTATTVRLAWTNPPDGTFLLVSAQRKGGTGSETADLAIDPTGTGLTEDGLSPDTEYTYTISAQDEAGNTSIGVSITVRTLPR